MPVTRLFPASSDASGSDLLLTGAATFHAALSDASDASYASRQLSQFETTRQCHGFACTQLPTGSGKMVGVVLNVRSQCNVNLAQQLVAGSKGDGSNPLLTQTLSDVPTTYSTGSLNLGGFAAVNALEWHVRHNWLFSDGAAGFTFEFNYDVTWFPITGFQAMIYQFLGAISALGLHEMPGLSDYLWRRYKTRLLPGELRQAWLDVREDRRRRYFALSR